MPHLDELIDQYYSEVVPAKRNDKVFGGIFWTHAYYPHRALEFWRPKEYLPGRPTFATAFDIQPAGNDAFKSEVLASPKKEINEEFLVIRAKRRPIVVLVPKTDIPVAKLKAGMTIDRPLSLVAQVFSVVDKASGESKLPLAFLEDIQKLKYPQFIFLPKKAGLFEVDSILRLDECQSVMAHYLEPTGYTFSDDLMPLLRSQFSHYCCGLGGEHYTDLKNLCNEDFS